jgi:hypothetical protein
MDFDATLAEVRTHIEVAELEVDEAKERLAVLKNKEKKLVRMKAEYDELAILV